MDDRKYDRTIDKTMDGAIDGEMDGWMDGESDRIIWSNWLIMQHECVTLATVFSTTVIKVKIDIIKTSTLNCDIIL